MHFAKTVTSTFLLSLVAMAQPTSEPKSLPIPADAPPVSALPGLEARGMSLNPRTNLVSFVNYQSPGCTGSATNHFPQTVGVCHTITGNSVNYYGQYGSCSLAFYTDSKCTNGNTLGSFGCWDISTRRSYAVFC